MAPVSPIQIFIGFALIVKLNVQKVLSMLPYGKKADMFSLGCILFELCTLE